MFFRLLFASLRETSIYHAFRLFKKQAHARAQRRKGKTIKAFLCVFAPWREILSY